MFLSCLALEKFFQNSNTKSFMISNVLYIDFISLFASSELYSITFCVIFFISSFTLFLTCFILSFISSGTLLSTGNLSNAKSFIPIYTSSHVFFSYTLVIFLISSDKATTNFSVSASYFSFFSSLSILNIPSCNSSFTLSNNIFPHTVFSKLVSSISNIFTFSSNHSFGNGVL